MLWDNQKTIEDGLTYELPPEREPDSRSRVCGCARRGARIEHLFEKRLRETAVGRYQRSLVFGAGPLSSAW